MNWSGMWLATVVRGFGGVLAAAAAAGGGVVVSGVCHDLAFVGPLHLLFFREGSSFMHASYQWASVSGGGSMAVCGYLQPDEFHVSLPSHSPTP